jgi:arsenite methyltransferase
MDRRSAALLPSFPIYITRNEGRISGGFVASASLDLDTEDLAQQYERVSAERQYKAGQRLVQDLEVKQGESVLDIGCGTGLLAEYVAGIVGAAGSVVGIDPLPLRIEIAQPRTRLNLSFRTGNGYDLSGFSSDAFDVVCMNAVFHWLPEKLEPLRQIIRVLRRGGRLGISTGSKGSPNPLHSVKTQVLSHAPYNQYQAASETVVHRVSAPELASLLTEAGFEVKKLETRSSSRPELTAEAAIEFSEASSFGNFLGHLPALAREDIRRELEKRVALSSTSVSRFHIVAIAIKPE